MRVLHVTNAYPTPERPHQGTFVAEQVEALRAAGIECEVHLLSGRGLARYATGARAVRERIASWDPDLVHVHYGWTGLAVRLARPGRPVLVSYCGNDALPVPARDPANRARNAVSLLVNRFVSPAFDAFVVKAGVLGRRLARSAGLPASAIHVVPNGIDLSTFPIRPREDCRRELGLDPAGTYVLTLGDPGDRSGVKRVDLARRATPPEATFLAPYPIARALVPTWMNAADCYLLTSACEGSPNVVKEALACGTPVVGTAVGDVPERIAGLPGCRVVAAGESAIRAAVRASLAERPIDRDALRRSIEPLETHLVAARIVEIYQGLLADAGPRFGDPPRETV